MAIVASSTAATPGLRTCDQLAAESMSLVRAPDSPDVKAIAKQGLNNGVLALNMRTWNWSLTSEDITAVVSTADYTFDSAFKAPYSMELLDSSSLPQAKLIWEAPQEFDIIFPYRKTVGFPSHYTVLSRDTSQLNLNAPASQGFLDLYPTMRLRHYQRVQKFSAGGSVLSVGPSEVELYLVAHAEWHLAKRFDPNRVEVAKRYVNELWSRLARDDEESLRTDWNTQ